MKKFFTFILMMLLALGGAAQSVQQRGIAYRYNGKKARTPLGNVRIKPAAAPNSVVSDSATGSFTLALSNLKMGARIGGVRVTRRGMMIFNRDAVDEWSVRRDPLVLILCDVDEFQRQKKNLVAIGERQARQKYDAQMAALEKELAYMKIENETYYNRLDSLDKEYQNALKNMDAYADVFARIDESEVDTVAQQAIELFNRGEIEESIRLFESGNYMKRLDDALRTKEHAQQLRQAADSAETLADSDIELAKRSMQAQISAYKLQNDWTKAGELLKHLADRLNTFDALWEYAFYCKGENNFTEAEAYFFKAESLLTDTSEDEINVVSIKENIADIYQFTQRFDESESIYNAAMGIVHCLAKDNPAAYEHSLAILQLKLAILYSITQRLDQSEYLYKAALEIFTRLTKNDPATNEYYLASTQMNLANLYSDAQRYVESEYLYKAALEIFTRLAKNNPVTYERDLASALANLANLYSDAQRYVEGENMYMAALEIYHRLAKDNSAAFESDLATTQTNLANLYQLTQRHVESENMYNAALEICKRLAKYNPAAFEPSLAKVQTNLAILYGQTERYGESVNMFNAALEIFHRLAKDNPAAFEPDLAEAQWHLAILYRETQRYNESVNMYNAALETYKRLAKENPSTYESDVLNIENILISVYSQMGDYQSAYSLNTDLIQTFKEHFIQNQDNWHKLYVAALTNQSFYANLLGRFSEGEELARETLLIDPEATVANTNLAAALLMQGKTDEAERLYRQYKTEYKDGFIGDFAEMERVGVIPAERRPDVERIKALLAE